MRWGKRAAREREMDEELRAHIEARTQANLAAGMAPAEAARAARVGFGALEAIKDACRDQRRVPVLADLAQDLRHGARLLARSPSFTIVAIATLALGIGASTAMWSVVDGLVLRPPPYPAPAELVHILERNAQHGNDGSGMMVSHINFRDWQAEQDAFVHLGLWRGSSFTANVGGGPVRLPAAQLGHEIWAALGVAPLHGRVFGPDDDRPGAARVVVLHHDFWAGTLGGDPARLGTQLLLDGRPTTIIGVMPPGFHFGGDARLWEPLRPELPTWQSRVRRIGLRALGRLAPGVDLATARAKMDAIAARLAERHPDSNRTVGIKIDRLQDSQSRGVRERLYLLFGAAGLVLLIACANVAGLLLARAVTRQREMALRAALGAGRGRLVRQLLAESLLLALAGGVVGLLFGHLFVAGVLGNARELLPAVVSSSQRLLGAGAAGIGLDARAFGFCAALALGTGIGFGLVPAWTIARLDLHAVIKRGGPGHTGRGASARPRQILVVAQAALTLLLLAGTGLLLRSFTRLLAVDPGFVPERVLSFRLDLPPGADTAPAARLAFLDAALERLRALPGVSAASFSTQIPLDARAADACLHVAGETVPIDRCRASELHMVEGDYFRVMRIPLVRGRSFTRADAGEPLRAIVIDERLAARFWPGRDPIGRRVTFPVGPDPRDPPPVLEVVGVVRPVKLDRLRESETRTQIYLPHRQWPHLSGFTVVLKTTSQPEALVAGVRQVVAALAPELPLTELETLTALTRRNLAPERLSLTIVALFAGLALVLAAVGLYGLTSYATVQREREIGLRVALGAGRGQVLRLVVGQGLRLVLLGAALGIAGALALGQVFAALLYQVEPSDPPTLALATTLLLFVGALASYLPARRAARRDPMAALRPD